MRRLSPRPNKHPLTFALAARVGALARGMGRRRTMREAGDHFRQHTYRRQGDARSMRGEPCNRACKHERLMDDETCSGGMPLRQCSTEPLPVHGPLRGGACLDGPHAVASHPRHLAWGRLRRQRRPAKFAAPDGRKWRLRQTPPPTSAGPCGEVGDHMSSPARPMACGALATIHPPPPPTRSNAIRPERAKA